MMVTREGPWDQCLWQGYEEGRGRQRAKLGCPVVLTAILVSSRAWAALGSTPSGVSQPGLGALLARPGQQAALKGGDSPSGGQVAAGSLSLLLLLACRHL